MRSPVRVDSFITINMTSYVQVNVVRVLFVSDASRHK
jgi:hypothetical protein